MPNWIRRTLYAVMLLCCMIIGARVYLELDPQTPAVTTGNIPSDLEMLPEFTLNNVMGEPLSISEWRGKPLLINFWATWCAPCRREMPLLQTLHNEYPVTGLQILGIAIDRQADVEAFITEAGISYPILWGEADAMAVSDQFGLPGLGLPFSVLVAADGNILTVHIGEVVREQLQEIVAVSQSVDNGELPVPEARERLKKL